MFIFSKTSSHEPLAELHIISYQIILRYDILQLVFVTVHYIIFAFDLTCHIISHIDICFSMLFHASHYIGCINRLCSSAVLVSGAILNKGIQSMISFNKNSRHFISSLAPSDTSSNMLIDHNS